MTPARSYEVLEDCEYCLTESGIIALFDPIQSADHPIERRCRMCSFTEALVESALVTVQTPQDLRAPEAALAAIERWAKEDGEPEADRFCRANLGGTSHETVQRLMRRERIPTNFDVIQYLFPSSSTGTNSSSAAEVVVPRPPATISLELPRIPESRTLPRFLASVLTADGRLRTGDLERAQRLLRTEGLPEILPGELRVWRPNELTLPKNRDLRQRAIQAALELVHVGGNPDDSEWRVIRDFALNWGISSEDLQLWHTQYARKYNRPLQRLWDQLTSMVRLH